MARILIIDDVENVRRSLKNALEKRGHDCVTAASIEQGREFVRAEFDIVLLDVFLGDGNGLDLLKEIQSRHPEQCVVMISGDADIDTAVQAIQHGAYDFIEKPISLDRLLVTIDNAAKAARLLAENRRLASLVYGDLIGESEPMRAVKRDIVRSAPRADRFLILGENGTGKELAAHMIHQHSKRFDGPFVAVNCAALPSELVESELFGHVRGAFTGASRDRRGKFLDATGGSIFLDEISEMPLEAQAKILRALEAREVTPVGSDQVLPIDCTIIAASNRDLDRLAGEGQFRQDLYYRLNVVTLRLPPLRERVGDIVGLADYFLRRFAHESGHEPKQMTPLATELLRSQPFPGNVRELKNLMERANIYIDGDTISAEQLGQLAPLQSDRARAGLKSQLEEFEREVIRSCVSRCENNMTRVARELGLERSHLYKKMKKLGIE